MSTSRIEGEVVTPNYTWESNYHINGSTSSLSILETRVFPALSKLPRRYPTVVADYGCGEGRIRNQAPYWSQRPYIFRGFEINRAAVQRYNNGSGREYIPDRAEVADLTALEVGQARFDAGLFWRVLHSIPKDLHEVVLSQIANTLKHGASLYTAVRSERDWVAADLEEKGFYRSGATNECYPAMVRALEPQGVTSWPLYFFREGEIARLGEQAGLVVVYQEPIQEPSGFKELRDRALLSYDYIEFVRP